MKIDTAEFRRLAPAAKLAAVRGQRAERFFQVDRSGATDEKARTCWLSIASEEPYERWWGIEVLDMNATSIRDERLRMGAPLLVGHDSADQVGVVESYEITSDRKLRILARFGRSDRAEEIFRDVLDGIRCNASVGYIIHDLVLEKQTEDVSTYRVTDWEPLEGSLVAVPADPTVGVGRSATQLTQRNHMKPQDNGASPGGMQQTAEGERSRILSLTAAGDEYANQGGREVARSLILDPNGSLDMFKARMLEAQRGSSRPFVTAQEADQIPFGDGARHDVSQGTKLRVFKGPQAERNAYAFGQFLISQLPGREDAARWCRENGIRQERYISSVLNQSGGFLVPSELASELIKNMDTYGVARREARVWPMKSESLRVPTRASGVTASFLVNDTETTAGDPSFGDVNLNTKEVMAVTNISVATMADSPISIGDFVAGEITQAFAKLEDQCLFIGDGTNTYGGMQGISPKLGAGDKLTAAATHDLMSEIDATDLANLMAKLPQYAQPGAKWYLSMAAYGAILQRLLLAAGGNTVRTLEAGASMNPSFAGFPVVLTPVLPSSTSASYTGLVMLLFGDLTRAAAFGDRQQISLMLDPYTLAGKGQIRMIGYERFEVVCHSVGDATVAGPVVGLVGA